MRFAKGAHSYTGWESQQEYRVMKSAVTFGTASLILDLSGPKILGLDEAQRSHVEDPRYLNLLGIADVKSTDGLGQLAWGGNRLSLPHPQRARLDFLLTSLLGIWDKKGARRGPWNFVLLLFPLLDIFGFKGSPTLYFGEAWNGIARWGLEGSDECWIL